jgi:GxxExxY protein
MAKSALSPFEEELATEIVDVAYVVHKTLGPGLLESVYEVCCLHELRKRKRKVERQVIVPVSYDGITFDEGFRIDLLVEDLVICELKAVKEVNPVFEAQLLSYMRLTNKRLGFLINFHVPLIKDGIQRFVR